MARPPNLPAHGSQAALPGAELCLVEGWLAAAQADALFAALQAGIAWETHRIRMFGRSVDSPRLSCWIGDPGTDYSYSGTRFAPHPWPAALQAVRIRLATELGCDFNSVLANRYRDGRDYMGWHSDDEPALGPRPVIASLSLGGRRRFLLRHRQARDQKLELQLGHGSLLIMRGGTQQHCQHALPRTAKPMGERINLTFRTLLLAEPG